jgi:hypothetical protein
VYKYPTFHDAGINGLKWAVMGRQAYAPVREKAAKMLEVTDLPAWASDEEQEKLGSVREGLRSSRRRQTMSMLLESGDQAFLDQKGASRPQKIGGVHDVRHLFSSHQNTADKWVAMQDISAVAGVHADAAAASPPATSPTAHPPHIVIINMCARWDRKNTQNELLDEMRALFEYGRTLMQDVQNSYATVQKGQGDAEPGHSSGGGSLNGSVQKLQLVWKSCTVDLPYYDQVSPRIDSLAREHGWEVLDVRQVSFLVGQVSSMIRQVSFLVAWSFEVTAEIAPRRALCLETKRFSEKGPQLLCQHLRTSILVCPLPDCALMPQIMMAARRQGIMLTWNTNTVHFLQLGYETMNDMLSNIMCPVSLT